MYGGRGVMRDEDVILWTRVSQVDPNRSTMPTHTIVPWLSDPSHQPSNQPAIMRWMMRYG